MTALFWIACAFNVGCGAFWIYSALKLNERRQALDHLLADLHGRVISIARREAYLADLWTALDYRLEDWLAPKTLRTKGQKETRH